MLNENQSFSLEIRKREKEFLQQKPCIFNRGRKYLNKTSFEVDHFKSMKRHYRLSS